MDPRPVELRDVEIVATTLDGRRMRVTVDPSAFSGPVLLTAVYNVRESMELAENSRPQSVEFRVLIPHGGRKSSWHLSVTGGDSGGEMAGPQDGEHSGR